MFTPVVNLVPSDVMAQNRYLPVIYQIWLLYNWWGHNLPLPHEIVPTNPDTTSYNTTFHQRVSDVSDWGTWLETCR